jgi:hypothetical protein
VSSATRIASRILLFALIGAAATVITAWGCIFRLAQTDDPHRLATTLMPFVTTSGDALPARRWPFEVPKDWPARGQPDWYAAAPGVSIEQWSLRTTVLHEAAWVKAGWPSRALGASRGRRVSLTPFEELYFERGLLNPSSSDPFRRSDFEWLMRPRFALHILWPGFLVDTAFWGGAAFLVWSVPGFVRRGVRRRRGRCVRCGYELKGLAVCPECGGGA